MKDLEFNKIAASILVAGLLATVAGKAADILYKTEKFEHSEEEMASVQSSEKPGGEANSAPEVIDISKLMSLANAETGKKIFKKCATCHTIDKGDKNRVGPNLYDIVGAEKAKKDGYQYSSALSEKGGKWDYDSLFAFLKKPKEFAPGTKMSFAGLRKPEDVANLIAFLRQNSDNPIELP
ncbi:cytochrome c family protein [Rickettsiales bacterium]|nr:cytochrome c family protein [Rickettsiales bacterium]